MNSICGDDDLTFQLCAQKSIPLSNPVSGFGPTLPRRAIGPIDKYLDTNITHRHRGYFLGKPFMNDISQQTGDFYSRTSGEK